MILTGFVFTLAIVSVSLFISASKEPLLEWTEKGGIREYEMVDNSYEEKVFQMKMIYCFSFVQHLKINKIFGLLMVLIRYHIYSKTKN